VSRKFFFMRALSIDSSSDLLSPSTRRATTTVDVCQDRSACMIIATRVAALCLLTAARSIDHSTITFKNSAGVVPAAMSDARKNMRINYEETESAKEDQKKPSRSPFLRS
jgi:hypothetical protein